jgi:toxin CptA
LPGPGAGASNSFPFFVLIQHDPDRFHAAAMSIAVSVLVRPSPGLRLLHAAFCGCVIGSALGCPGVWLPLVCGAGGVAGLLVGLRNTSASNAHQIDISETGQIRLTHYRVDEQVGEGVRGQAAERVIERVIEQEIKELQHIEVDNGAEPLRLLPGSTLWPGLLLLRLGGAGGGIKVLAVLPDSVTRTGFRALALACRALAARAGPF